MTPAFPFLAGLLRLAMVRKVFGGFSTEKEIAMKPLRKATIRLHLEALEDRLMPTTLIGGIAVQMGPVVLPDWFQSNLYDAGIQTLARTEYNRDQMLTRNDMLELFAQAKIDGVVSSNEFHDLSALVAAG